MPQPRIPVRIPALAAVLLFASFAPRAFGTPLDTKAPPVFAVVDFQKLSTGYKAKDSVEAEIRAMQAKFDGRLGRRDNMPYLSEEEHKQLDAIYEKDKPGTPRAEADNNKIKDFENRNKQKYDEIQAIRQKKDTELNDGDRAKLKAADESFQEAQKRFAAMKDELSNQLNSLGKNKSDDLMARIRSSIAKVAEQKGYSVVFNSEVTLYSGADITDQVVGELNKNASPGKVGDKAGSGFALVDFQKVATEYKAKDAIETELKSMGQKFDGRIARRDVMPFLTEEEHKQLDTILEKPTKSEADNAKVKELEGKNKQKSDEIEALRNKKESDQTEAEKTKLRAAAEALGEAKKRYDQLKEDLSAQINQFNKSKSDELMTKIKSAVSKVAGDKGIAMVFNSEVALYAGMDITDQVVTELNKK